MKQEHVSSKFNHPPGRVRAGRKDIMRFGNGKEALIIDTFREGYSIDQISRTMTVGDLIDFLSEYDEETPVVLGFDRRYTYGSIQEYMFEEIETEGAD